MEILCLMDKKLLTIELHGAGRVPSTHDHGIEVFESIGVIY